VLLDVHEGGAVEIGEHAGALVADAEKNRAEGKKPRIDAGRAADAGRGEGGAADEGVAV
jgi:hypothetical protein